MRKLASIQKITEIREIPNADKIVMARVLGWECIVKKDEFKVGDTVVYVEIDSVLPERPEFEFLRSRKFRVKTIELRGQVSQGLVLPMSVLPSTYLYETRWMGQDVTELLGIIKYDPQGAEEDELVTDNVNAVVKFLRRFKWYRKLFMVKDEGGFPTWIKKTDETRIQSMPEILEDEKNTLLQVTEKLDGQSATYFLKREKFGRMKFGVCSRKVYLKTPGDNNYWKIARKYNIEKVLRNIIGKNDYVILQGEIVGEGIQGNKYKIKGLKFYAFNLIYPEKQYPYFSMASKLSSEQIDCVPIISDNWTLPETMDEAVNFSIGKSVVNPNIQREGVVCRDTHRSKVLSFKIINPKFLLENKE